MRCGAHRHRHRCCRCCHTYNSCHTCSCLLLPVIPVLVVLELSFRLCSSIRKSSRRFDSSRIGFPLASVSYTIRSPDVVFVFLFLSCFSAFLSDNFTGHVRELRKSKKEETGLKGKVGSRRCRWCETRWRGGGRRSKRRR